MRHEINRDLKDFYSIHLGGWACVVPRNGYQANYIRGGGGGGGGVAVRLLSCCSLVSKNSSSMRFNSGSSFNIKSILDFNPA